MNKVSVIVPIYNVELYLDNCIESILNQTYKNIEIILVDDGSTDSSLTICNKYKNNKNLKVIHKKNGGVSSARNIGMKNSTGEFICFVDGDDYIMPDYVEYLLNMITKYNTDIALTTSVFTNYNMKQVPDKIRVIDNISAQEMILCYKIPIGVYSKIFRKDFLLKNNIEFLTELCMGEGFNFNVTSFGCAKNIAVGNRKIYFYRRDNENSVTNVFNRQKFDNGLYAIELIKKNLPTSNKRLVRAIRFANFRTHTDVYDLIVLSGAKKENKDLYDSCRQEIRKSWWSCFLVPTSFFQKLRSTIIFICPPLIPHLMRIRKKRSIK